MGCPFSAVCSIHDRGYLSVVNTSLGQSASCKISCCVYGVAAGMESGGRRCYLWSWRFPCRCGVDCLASRSAEPIRPPSRSSTTTRTIWVFRGTRIVNGKRDSTCGNWVGSDWLSPEIRFITNYHQFCGGGQVRRLCHQKLPHLVTYVCKVIKA